MDDKYFLLIWSIAIIMMGSSFAFGSPTIIRGYNELKNEPQNQRNLLKFNRIGGVFFFVLGQLTLPFAVLDLLPNLSDAIGLGVLLLLFLAYVLELVLLIGCKELKKRKYLLSSLKNVLLYYSSYGSF